MPIAYQDLYLLLRAENLGTNAITSFGGMVEALGAKGKMTAAQLSTIGSALVTGGTVLTAAGAIGLKFWYDAGKAAADYQSQAAYSLTQAAGYGLSLKKVEQIGISVAKAVPVAFDSVQTGLYNIFSTVKATAPQYQSMLTQFAKAAVAGNSDITTTSRTTIGELKAFGLPITDIKNLLDDEFQMVKLGRGTYSDFIDVLASAIPVYAANGQSIQEMMSNMSFMTRSGATTGAAVASISRAVESLSKAGFQSGLQSLGISFLNAHGKAKQLDTIVGEIAHSPKWQAMVKASGGVGQAFVDNFGQGTIQARRFFDLALTRYPMLQTVMKGMADSPGAMERAYKIMSTTTVAQTQLLKNNFKALQITLGQDVLPIFNKFLGYLEKVLKWFNNLSPSVKKFIALGSLFGSLGAVIGGVTLIMSGFFLKFISSIMTITGKSLPELVGGLGDATMAALPYIAAAVAIGVAIYFVIKYHKEIWAWLQKVWHDALTWVDRAKQSFDHLSGSLKVLATIIAITVGGPLVALAIGIKAIIKYHKDLEHWALVAWKAVKDAAGEAWNWMKHAAQETWDTITDGISNVTTFFQNTWQSIFNWWSTNWGEVDEVVKTAFNLIKDTVKASFDLIKPVFMANWNILVTVTKAAWTLISGAVRDAWKIITTVFDGAFGIIRNAWDIFWDALMLYFKVFWDILSGSMKMFWTAVEGIFTVALDLLTGHWSKAWDDIKHYFVQFKNDFMNLFKELFNNLIAFFNQIAPRVEALFFDMGKLIIQLLWEGIQATWHLIYNFFSGIVKVFKSFFANMWNAMYEVGKEIVMGIWQGVKDTWHILENGAKGLFGHMFNFAKSMLGIHSPSTVYYDLGLNMAKGLANGVTDGTPIVSKAIAKMLATLEGGTSTGSAGNSSTMSALRNKSNQGLSLTLQKGAISISVSTPSGKMSTTDQNNLQEMIQDAIDQAFTQLDAKVKSKKVAA